MQHRIFKVIAMILVLCMSVSILPNVTVEHGMAEKVIFGSKLTRSEITTGSTITIAPSAELQEVFWNPNKEDGMAIDGIAVIAAGNDANDGTSASRPVLTLEKAIALAGSKATIYCMNSYRVSEKVLVADGQEKTIRIVREKGYSGSIFLVGENGTLTLKNITLTGNESETPLITVADGGQLIIDEGVRFMGEMSYVMLETGAKPIHFTGVPEKGSVYFIALEKAKENLQIAKVNHVTSRNIDFIKLKNNLEAEDLKIDIENGMIQLKKKREIDAMHSFSHGGIIQEIYINGGSANSQIGVAEGRDSNDGLSINAPVKTFAKAKELAEQYAGKKREIIICGPISISGTGEKWELDEDTKLIRYSGYAGVLVEISNSSLTLSDVMIDGNKENSPMYSAAAISLKNSKLIIEGNTSIANNKNVNKSDNAHGGAIILDSSTLEMKDNACIIGNTADYGGGVFGEKSSTIKMSGNVRISENKANQSGGGIFINASTLLMEADSKVSYNQSSNNGGGIHQVSGLIEMRDYASLAYNEVMSAAGGCYGGAIYSQGKIVMTDHASIQANKSNYGGGMWIFNNATVDLMGEAEVSHNTAINWGGGMGMSNSAQLVIKDQAKIAQNKASRGGGLYLSQNDDGKALTCSLYNEAVIGKNTASSYGGGIWQAGGRLMLYDHASISGNETQASGGGIYQVKGLIEIRDYASLSYNEATSAAGSCYGGAIYSEAEIVITDHASIQANKSNYGGGIWIFNNATAELMGEAEVSHNTAIDWGGGMGMSNTAKLVIKDQAKIAQNKALRGGGLYLSQYDDGKALTCSLYNEAAIEKNTASSYGGGIWQAGGRLMLYDHASISGNETQASGGGIGTKDGIVEMNDYASIIENKADTSGGGIYLESSEMQMLGGQICGNEAQKGNGGGLFITTNSSTVPILLEGTIRHNQDKADSQIYVSSDRSIGMGKGVLEIEGKIYLEEQATIKVVHAMAAPKAPYEVKCVDEAIHRIVAEPYGSVADASQYLSYFRLITDKRLTLDKKEKNIVIEQVYGNGLSLKEKPKDYLGKTGEQAVFTVKYNEDIPIEKIEIVIKGPNDQPFTAFHKDTDKNSVVISRLISEETIGTYCMEAKYAGVTVSTDFVLSGYKLVYEGTNMQMIARVGRSGEPYEDQVRLNVYSGYQGLSRLSFSDKKLEGLTAGFVPVLTDQMTIDRIDLKDTFAAAVVLDEKNSTNDTKVIDIRLKSSNNLSSLAEGKIVLKGVTLVCEGNTSATDIEVPFKIETVTGAVVRMEKDNEWLKETCITLKNGGITYELEKDENSESYYVESTGSTLTEGNYDILKDGRPTGKFIEIIQGWLSKLTLKYYTLKLMYNDGTDGFEEKEVLNGTKYGDTLAPLTREGHYFEGYYTKNGTLYPYDQGAEVELIESQTLYAKWKKMTHTLEVFQKDKSQPLVYGYKKAVPIILTVKNTGNTPITDLKVSLGDNSSFELISIEKQHLMPEEVMTIEVMLQPGLAAGQYGDILSVQGKEMAEPMTYAIWQRIDKAVPMVNITSPVEKDTYVHRESKLPALKGEAVHEGEKVKGKLEWQQPSQLVQQSGLYGWQFIPEVDGNYESVMGKILLKVTADDDIPVDNDTSTDDKNSYENKEDLVVKEETDHPEVFDENKVLYYLHENKKIIIGFGVVGHDRLKYIAPPDVMVYMMHNTKYFDDIEGHWAKPAIDFITEREIFVGVTKKSFSPNGYMSREMVVTILGRLYERSYEEIPLENDQNFEDVDKEAYYAKYIAWAKKEGLVVGRNDKVFDPNAFITREEFAKILLKYSQMLGQDIRVSEEALELIKDKEKVSMWAVQSIAYCVDNALIVGSNQELRPTDRITRAESAQIIKRYIEMIIDSEEAA